MSCAFTSAVLGRREHFPLHTETLRASRTTGVTAGVSQEDGEQAGPDGQEKGKVEAVMWLCLRDEDHHEQRPRVGAWLGYWRKWSM